MTTMKTESSHVRGSFVRKIWLCDFVCRSKKSCLFTGLCLTIISVMTVHQLEKDTWVDGIGRNALWMSDEAERFNRSRNVLDQISLADASRIGKETANTESELKNAKSDDGNTHVQSYLRNQKTYVEVNEPSLPDRRTLQAEMSAKFKRRRALLYETCTTRPSHQFTWNDNLQLIAAPQRRVVVCIVQKAGSTSWNKVIYNLRHNDTRWLGKGRGENRDFTKKLPSSTKFTLMRSPDVTRVLCTRHPFARLISGWNDKFEKRFISRVGTVIMFNTMPGLSDYVNKTSLPDEHHVISFEDFVQYIADNGLGNVDVHFKSIEQLCGPCAFPYDYILKAESALADTWWVLSRFNGWMKHFPVHSVVFDDQTDKDGIEMKNQTRQGLIISDSVRNFFARVPHETIRKLKLLYYEDFRRFGYTFDVDNLTSGGFD